MKANEFNFSGMCIKETMEAIMAENGLKKMNKASFDKISKSAEKIIKKVVFQAKSISRHSQRKKITVNDINEALELNGMNRLYGYICKPNIEYEAIPNTDMIIPKDKTINIDELLRTNPLPINKEEYFSFHWQCIRGEDPRIAEVALDECTKDETDISIDEINWNLEGEKKSGNKSKAVSVAQQDFFIETVEAFMKNDDKNVFCTLRSNKSLQFLLPFFIKFINDFLSVNMYDSVQVYRSLIFTKSLFENKTINTDKFCQSFINIVLTICATPIAYEGEHKFNVRNEAAILLEKMIAQYENCYPYLREAIIKNLIEFYNNDNIYQKYGATTAIFSISHSLFESIILPDLRTVLDGLKKDLETTYSGKKMDIMNMISLYLSLTQRCFAEFDKTKTSDPKKICEYNNVLSFKLL